MSSTIANPALSMQGVTKRFRGHDAVVDLTLSVQAGSIFGLLGPNGAGKTTAIRMVVNILVPDAGEIRILGERVGPGLKRRIGYLPEERGLYKDMKAGELLVYFAAIKGIEIPIARRRAVAWLERLGLAQWADREVQALSKGMSQKLQFALAVLHEPPFLILDEPFTGLDPVSVRTLEEAIQELRRRGTTIVLSTHQMDRAEKLCDEICLMHKARKVLEGTIPEVRRRFGENVVRIAFRGSEAFLAHESVLSVVRRDSGVELRLRPGADSHNLLASALASGARIERFEHVEPTLDDIFIASVSGPA